MLNLRHGRLLEVGNRGMATIRCPQCGRPVQMDFCGDHQPAECTCGTEIDEELDAVCKPKIHMQRDHRRMLAIRSHALIRAITR